MRRILVRATNWVGDAVMSLPALRAIRQRFPEAYIAVLARPAVVDLYKLESGVDRVIPYVHGRWRTARQLRAEQFDCAILLQNAFDAALLAWMARIPRRIGYNRDARGWLLTGAVPVPRADEIPKHQRFYYLELLRRAGMLDTLPQVDQIRLTAPPARRADLPHPIIGISPGAAYGSAKRWLPERFAEAAMQVGGGSVALFGAAADRGACKSVAALIQGIPVHNFAGETSLGEFISLAAACDLFLTNDSGAMHIASALGIPTVAVFGATDDTATGPTGPLARVVRHPVECSPCLLRECPIDHRCMTRVTVENVTQAAAELRLLYNARS